MSKFTLILTKNVSMFRFTLFTHTHLLPTHSLSHRSATTICCPKCILQLEGKGVHRPQLEDGEGRHTPAHTLADQLRGVTHRLALLS